jgi:hypothetical protein
VPPDGHPAAHADRGSMPQTTRDTPEVTKRTRNAPSTGRSHNDASPVPECQTQIRKSDPRRASDFQPGTGVPPGISEANVKIGLTET